MNRLPFYENNRLSGDSDQYETSVLVSKVNEFIPLYKLETMAIKQNLKEIKLKEKNFKAKMRNELREQR